MDVMDKLFELYNGYFDGLEEAARRLNAEFPIPSKIPINRKSREEFEDYLINGADSEWKRGFLTRVLDGHEELYPILPECVKETLIRNAA